MGFFHFADMAGETVWLECLVCKSSVLVKGLALCILNDPCEGRL